MAQSTKKDHDLSFILFPVTESAEPFKSTTLTNPYILLHFTQQCEIRNDFIVLFNILSSHISDLNMTTFTPTLQLLIHLA